MPGKALAPAREALVLLEHPGRPINATGHSPELLVCELDALCLCKLKKLIARLAGAGLLDQLGRDVVVTHC